MTAPKDALAKIGSARHHDRMIQDGSVEAALDWLRDGAATLGKAKERTVKAGHMLKHTEALEFKMADGSIENRKAYARTSERYLAAVNEDAAAAGEYERLKALREAAAMVIETWRSEQATWRAMKL